NVEHERLVVVRLPVRTIEVGGAVVEQKDPLDGWALGPQQHPCSPDPGLALPQGVDRLPGRQVTHDGPAPRDPAAAAGRGRTSDESAAGGNCTLGGKCTLGGNCTLGGKGTLARNRTVSGEGAALQYLGAKPGPGVLEIDRVERVDLLAET